MVVAINPGTGKVSGNYENAELNIKAFLRDLNVDETNFTFVSQSDDGRFDFNIWNNQIEDEISMPGLSLEQVRYLGEKGQNIWHFPRLYVNGSSWVWKFALNQCLKPIYKND